MGYEIQYNLTDTEDAKAQAIADCRKWLGVRQFNKVVRALKADAGRSSKKLVLFGLSLQGIQGYPALVMADTYWNKQRELDLV
jgi:hypothetical protein